METLILTIAYNRNRFLALSMASVLSQAKNATYVIWDNASNQATETLVQNMTGVFVNESVEVVYQPSSNIGLNAAFLGVQKFRTEKTKYVITIDEDILMLPLGFQQELQRVLDTGIVGYAALDVFQDAHTNGAKPSLEHYNRLQIAGRTLLEGPTGGWASMCRMEEYDAVGGYPQRSELFFGLDGIFSESIRNIGKKTGIVEGLCCYHATGDSWNQGFGFHDVLDSKLASYRRWYNAGSP